MGEITELRQTVEYAEYMRLLGWEVMTSAAGIRAYLRKIPLLPWRVMKLQRVGSGDIDFKWLEDLMGGRKFLVMYVELLDGHPLYESAGGKSKLKRLEALGFCETASGMLPTKTRIVSIGQAREKILAGMEKRTRYSIRSAERNGLEVEIVSGSEMLSRHKLFDEFLQLLGNSWRRRGWPIASKNWPRAEVEAFGDVCYVVLIKNKDQELLAGSIFLMVDPVAYYAHNGSTAKGRELMAPTLAVWEGMLEAKRLGTKWLDFDGIYDERYPIKAFKGFSRFKAGFGGEEVEYRPAYAIWLPRLLG